MGSCFASKEIEAERAAAPTKEQLVAERCGQTLSSDGQGQSFYIEFVFSRLYTDVKDFGDKIIEGLGPNLALFGVETGGGNSSGMTYLWA